MLEVLQVFSEKTGTRKAIEKAVLSGADQRELFDLLVELHRRNIETAQSIMVDQLIKRRVAEKMREYQEQIIQDIETLKNLIPDDPDRLRLAVDLSLDLTRKCLEEQTRRECAIDIDKIVNDFRY